MDSPLVIFIVFVWFLFSPLISSLISLRSNSNKNRLITKHFNQNFQSIDVITKKNREVFTEERKGMYQTKSNTCYAARLLSYYHAQEKKISSMTKKEAQAGEKANATNKTIENKLPLPKITHACICLTFTANSFFSLCKSKPSVCIQCKLLEICAHMRIIW